MDDIKRSDCLTIIDAGGRYGIQDAWKKYPGVMKYFVFEPDQVEALRLKKKYQNNSWISISELALSDQEGETELNILRHKGLSSRFEPNPESAFFVGQRQGESEVIERRKVAMTTIDSFASENNLNIDFLKVDTEGSELDIFKGAHLQMSKNVLGIKAEVYFQDTYHGTPSFSSIHKLLWDSGYVLLNMEYCGRGDAQNHYVDATGRYGVITATDVIYVKNIRYLFDFIDNKVSSSEGRMIEVFKYAAYCLLYNASDVAIQALLNGLDYYGGYDAISKTSVHGFVDLLIAKLFYKIKYQPAQSIDELNQTYKRLFSKNMLLLNEFYENEQINPA